MFNGACFLAPFVGWFADVKLGRYRVILCGVAIRFVASITLFVGIYSESLVGDSYLMMLPYLGFVLDVLSFACFSSSMLPFMTDQLIGATANELSSIVHWYFWVRCLLSNLLIFTSCLPVHPKQLYIIIGIPCTALLAIVVVSDCLCQQWLDRTHKVTNPIKLIVQVLNYARKHRYPERRSAFTYMDEEQPSRMDFGKGKFGGPFTEEEVEDVKTVLRIIPLVACISTSLSAGLLLVLFGPSQNHCALYNIAGPISYLPGVPVLILIPVYQLFLYPCFYSWFPRLLRRIGAGLFLQLVGYIWCFGLLLNVYARFSDWKRYLTCKALPVEAETPDSMVEWYWKVGPLLLWNIGNGLGFMLLLEFVVAQSPDKMKGFVFGITIALQGGVAYCVPKLLNSLVPYTLCSDLPMFILLMVLFIAFILLSKCYKLRERNREINIQAIVEEHYERYIDQEQEYEKQQHHLDLSSSQESL